MIGKQHFKSNLAILCRFSIVILLLFTSLSGCNSDWSYELPNNYAITRANKRTVALTYKEPTSSVSEIVIRNYYVLRVCTIDKYILTEGVHTLGIQASDEELDMLESTSTIYYLIDSVDGTLYGPFRTEDALKTQLQEIGNNANIFWIYPG